jgi:hypothetical protein
METPFWIIMPWNIRRSGSQYEVVQENNGRVMGKHPTRSSAERQLAALYASEPSASKISDSGPTPPIDGSAPISNQDTINRNPQIINGSKQKKKKPQDNFWNGSFFPRNNP